MARDEDGFGLASASPGQATGGMATGFSAYTPVAARIAGLLALVLVGVWVHSYLGGLALSSPGILFNWHPILMTLGFAVLMTEAVLAYKSPWQRTFSRPQRKQVHWIFHSAALVCAVLGFIAAWKSHTLADPPIPNFYSPHSFLGAAALLLLLGQFVYGFSAYLWPTIALDRRAALGPVHRFWGLATWGTGMAAAALGCQEKATFLQAFGKKAVYSGFLRLPAVTELLLLATVLLVLWQYSPAAAPPSARRQQVQYTAVQADEEGGASGST
eukprot:gene5615-5853_t